MCNQVINVRGKSTGSTSILAVAYQIINVENNNIWEQINKLIDDLNARYCTSAS